jgi:pimeloyl-ACP methyl ester carboxylesterase
MELLERPIESDLVEERLGVLAARYQGAGGAVIQLLNMAGGQADGLIERLPPGMRDNLGQGTEQALRLAMKAAESSRGVVGDGPGWLSTAISTALGAAGGFGGLPSALAELPVTTTVLLHGIQGVAVEHGFDPAEPGVQFDCIQVFSAAGPLEHDDGSDLAFLSTRMIVTGAAMQALIARVAPKLAVVLGQKLAAQTVPVLGAVAGAATNYAYSSYYREMAHVHFGLRRLAIEADRDHGELVGVLRGRLGEG